MIRGFRPRVAWVLALACLMATTFATAQPRRDRNTNRPPPTAAPTDTPAAATVPTVAANVCIAPEARARALECPPGSQNYGSHHDTSPPAAARATTDAPNKNQKKAAPAQQLDTNLLLRHQAIAARSRELLLREAQLTATLVNRMSRTDSHRPDALMRLAEDYQELTTQTNGQAEDLEDDLFAARTAHNEPQVADITRRQEAFRTEANTYRQSLITAFRHLVEEHPQYEHMDQALFYLAFAYQDSNDFNNARTVYRTLIQRFPQSPYVPNAYLSFAEYFFEQGEMENARQFYERVLAVQDESNQVYGYALYKMAWVLYNLQEYEESLNKFFQVIEYGRAHPQSASVTPLLRNARMELVTVYAAVYGNAQRPLNTTHASNTFRRYALDENNGFEMFEHLAELYQDNGQWPNSIAAYHTMMEQRTTSDRFCFWQSQVARAVVASRPKPEQMTEVTRLVDVYTTFGSSQRSQEVKNSCRDYAARVVFDVASHWHLEAIGRSAEGAVQTRGTRNPETMRLVAQLYQTLIDQFPQFDQVTFPDYDRRDWPSLYRVAYYRADILRDQGNVQECGPAYDHVIEMNPQGEYTEDAAYKAVLCYNDSFATQLGRAAIERPAARTAARNNQRQTAEQARAAERARVVPRDFSTQETGMLRAFTRYACFVRAGAAAPGASAAAAAAANSGDPAENPGTVMLTIKYRRAYLYYNANKFEEAATLFHDIAHSDMTVPDPEGLRELSADLYLDSLNVMGDTWNPQRPFCFDTMAEELPTLLSSFCTPTTRPQHEDFCHRVEELQCQVLRKKAEALGATRRFAEAGREYVTIARTHRECGRIDEMLYNAAIMYDAALQLGRAMRVRERLVQIFLERNSPWAQRALYRLAANYHAIQVFRRAAELYEQYADYVNTHRREVAAALATAQAEANRTHSTITQEDPVEQAADALRRATIFRIGLGEENAALTNSRKFAQYFGNDPSRRRSAANVVFSIGQIYVDRVARLRRQPVTNAEDRAHRNTEIRTAWGDVITHYSNYMRTYAAQGTLDQQIQGAVALARGYWNQDDTTHAVQYYTQAVTAWGTGTPAAGEATIRQQLGDEAGDAVEKSKDAVAEAKFYLAEVLYNRFMGQRVPTISGTNRRAFDTWVTRSLTPYIVARQATLTLAEAKFAEVIEMHVPQWEIAAAARLADMYYQFARTIRESPVPPDVQHNADLMDAWNLVRDERTQPFINNATTGFLACITRSTNVHWFNEWSQLCERNLNAIDRNRFPIADEVRVEPNLVFSRAANSRPVYQLQTSAEGEEEGGGGNPGAEAGGDNARPANGGGR